MTLREIIELVREDSDESWPVEAMFAVCGALRTAAQGEASTYDGDCTGLLAWTTKYGPPTSESVRQFMDECPQLMEMEIPDSALLQWVNSND